MLAEFSDDINRIERLENGSGTAIGAVVPRNSRVMALLETVIFAALRNYSRNLW